MKMKELEELTGVGREAIRYYIREGLLPEPEKPRRNVAIYSQEHVNRIGVIRKLKDERFLPLGVIRELLDDPALGDAASSNLVGLEFLLSARLGTNSQAEISVSEFVDTRSLERQEIEAMNVEGIVTFQEGPNGPMLSGQDVRIAGIWADLKNAGFDTEPDLRGEGFTRYRDAAELLAEEEVETFYNSVAETSSTEEAAAMAEQGIALVEELFSILHAKAILRRIAERSADEAAREPEVAD